MLALTLALLAGVAVAHGNSLRGVNPDLAAHYSGSGGTFSCITGGSKTIPFARVNDDYCDCPDGSDEPGTAACHNGRFYCRNLGHEPRLLASAFVDDGVCDCCDGTDEPKGKCKNTCLQASAVHREALKNKILSYEQTLQTKADYIAKARSFKEELNHKAPTIADDIDKQSAEVERLKAEVSRLEAEDEAARAEEARLAEEARIAEEARLAEEARAAADLVAATAEGAAATEEAAKVEEVPAADGAEHVERELQEQGENAQPEEREETPEERGRRIASQWTNDPEAAAVPGQHDEVTEDGEEQAEEDGGHYDGEDNQGDYDRGVERPDDEYMQEQHDIHQQHQHRPPRPPRHADTNTPLGAARTALYAAENVLRGLEKDKENIRTFLQLGLDFGPDDIFLALADQCFSSHQTRWTYEICMFKNAVQREGYSNTVTVGRWYGFSEDYKKMYFTGGDECWNVGPRSLTVSMSCGNEEKLSDGEEPSTCAYAAKFTSPALCNETELEELRQQLRNLEAFEKEVRAMILKDEL